MRGGFVFWLAVTTGKKATLPMLVVDQHRLTGKKNSFKQLEY
jgi:hypothetical protein